MSRFAQLAIVTACALCSTASAAVDYWQLRSAPGFVRSLAVDPGDPDVVYAAMSNAATYYGEHVPAGQGLFRSDDGGRSWTPRNNGLTNLMTSAIVIDPSAPGVLYVATAGGGVFKSVDGALSWVPQNTGLGGLSVYSLAIDPQTPTTLYAGLEGAGLYRTTDGAATWVPGPGLAPSTVWAIAVDPATPGTLYAGLDLGVFKSVNGGAGWTTTGPLHYTIPGDPTVKTGGEVRALLIDASAPATVYAGLADGSGMFKSVDAGATWAQASVGLLSEFGNDRFITVLAQDPLAPATLYASSTGGTFRSRDGGATWAAFNTGLARLEGFSFGIHASGAVYFAEVFGDAFRLATRASGIDHFRCVKARAHGVAQRVVTVSDEFGTTTATALRPLRFCTPTSFAGEPVTNPDTALVCYKLTHGDFSGFSYPGFLANRVDGYRGFDARKIESLCVPATVGGGPGGAPRDAYRCGRGPHYPSPGLDVVLSDALGTQLVRRTTLDRWCVPTDLDGGGGANRLEPGMDLRCDLVKLPKPVSLAAEVTTTDRFGSLTLTLSKPDSNCVPALEDIIH